MILIWERLMRGRGADDTTLARAAYGAGRTTSQRLTIASVVDGTRGRAFSVEQLSALVRRADAGIGTATVYRAVSAMETSGFIESLGSRDGAALYARCPSGAHHHHMLCTSCNAVADVDCPVSPGGATAPGGFRVTGHRLVLYGVCSSCESAGIEGAGAGRVEPDCCGEGPP